MSSMDVKATMEIDHRPRKACDLCYTRKLKCNGQEPRCSNCIIYARECTHTAQSRRSRPKTRHNGGNGTTRADEVQNLRARVQELETQLTQNPIQNDSHQSAGSHNNANSSMILPPLQQALPMIEMFLNKLNSVLPLFHAGTLLRLVGECYSRTPRQRDPVAWAAINVVLALTCQQVSSPDGDGDAGTQAHRTTEYLNRAQSVISDVMLSETRLLNIQTLVGMVMVLQSAHDPTQALILIAATIRLAHKMGLQNRVTSAHLDPEERRQHTHVFWLVYILDKDLSLRAQQPSIQLDDDIDLDLPHSLPADDDGDGDTPGVIATADGNARMNYFLARVQLANIEGGVYDCIFSTRAAKRSPEERLAAANSVLEALEKWQAEIPSEFGAAAVITSTANDSTSLGLFCVLHSISLRCMTLVNRAHAWNDEWVRGVHDIVRGGMGKLQLPIGWATLVHQARDFMILFERAWSAEIWFRWIVSCPYVSSMMVLVTNNLRNLLHHRIQLDSQLVDKALQWLKAGAEETQREDVRILRDICVDIVQRVERKRAAPILGVCPRILL
ncbi:Zn(2)-C6 fungal-type domain-containing protein [Trichoderma simmonsii]|uniref:Zn(2)-C6 fungal-type domain-containing protein n=2 Tax=Trichoderma simmonsii TaxID=1491479 RepID=A0A8G0PC30_9HYPO|nr:Zn(2)-C6 fungal-type domain-containing protein [Trichoderma simmonsii]